MLMFSATWPEEVQTLANDFLKNTRLMIKIGGDENIASENVKQVIDFDFNALKTRSSVKSIHVSVRLICL